MAERVISSKCQELDSKLYKNKGDASYATAGAGVEYAGVHLDFAWMFAGHECLARNTFWISLGYSF